MSIRRLACAALLAWLAVSPARAAVIVVDTTADGITGPLCDIRDALNAANTDQASGGCTEVTPSGADVIDLTGLAGSIDLDSLPLEPLPTIQESVTLLGPGADVLRIDGLDATQILVVENGTLVVEGLTIANGAAPAEGRGGCVSVLGAGLVLRDSRVTSCFAFNGGGIANDNSATRIERSLIDANTAGNSGAGVINDHGELEIVDSTLSGNVATQFGGGVATFADSGTATTRIHSSTIARNGAGEGGNVFGGFEDGEETILTHTLLANPTAGGDCAGGAVTSEGFNLASDASCALGATGDLPSTPAGMANTLADSGGPTQTHALSAGSAAIDGGIASGCRDTDGSPIDFDQRGPGFPRRTDGDDDGIFACDIGAYETVPEPGGLLAALGGGAVLARLRRRRYLGSQPQETRCTSRSATR